MQRAPLEERYGLSSSTKKIYITYEMREGFSRCSHSLRSASSEFMMQTGAFCDYRRISPLTIYLINKWYLTTVEELLHSSLDLASWRQYIERNKGRKERSQSVASTSEVALAYMLGTSRRRFERPKKSDRDGLQPQF